MPRVKRRSRTFGHDPKLKGNIAVLVAIVVVLAIGIWLMVASSGGGLES